MKTRIKKMMLKMQEGRVIASVAGVTLAFAFALGLYAFRGAIFVSSVQDAPVPEIQAAQEIHRHPLTGAPLEEPLEDLPQVFAVMIDDHYEAHPQSGIDQAFLAIEAPVEANIPRIEAFFYEGQVDPEQIGPVRSARPYYLDWASEFDAMYVHVGGSPEALELIRVGDTFDFNQFWNGNSFWRSNKKPAPYNVYTSLALLREGLEKEKEKGRAPEHILYGEWIFKDHDPSLSEEAVGVEVHYSSPTYVVEWEFDQESNRYERWFAGRKDRTLEGASVWADNVAIVIADVEVVDGVGRRHVKTVGEGEAIVLQDGIKIEGVWKKSSASERLTFFDMSGVEIAMNPGATWIQVVGSEEWVEVVTTP